MVFKYRMVGRIRQKNVFGFGTKSRWMVSLNDHLEVTLCTTYCVIAVIGLLVGLVNTAFVGKHPHNHPVIRPLKHHPEILIQGIIIPRYNNIINIFQTLQFSCIRFQTSCNRSPNRHTEIGTVSLYCKRKQISWVITSQISKQITQINNSHL